MSLETKYFNIHVFDIQYRVHMGREKEKCVYDYNDLDHFYV